jgi:hypothetical protein
MLRNLYTMPDIKSRHRFPTFMGTQFKEHVLGCLRFNVIMFGITATELVVSTATLDRQPTFTKVRTEWPAVSFQFLKLKSTTTTNQQWACRRFLLVPTHGLEYYKP